VVLQGAVLLAGLAAGAVSVLLKELFDQTFRTTRQVTRSLGLAVLESIDEIVPSSDRARVFRRKLVYAPICATILLSAVGVTCAMAYLSIENPHAYQRLLEVPPQWWNRVAGAPVALPVAAGEPNETSPVADPVSSAAVDVWSALLPGNAACTTVYYQIVAVDDLGAESSTVVYDYTVECAQTTAEIQGYVDPSPYEGATVTTSGVVTAVALSGAGSFFIQDAGAEWSGIQVYGSSAVAVGDEVAVTGEVDEYFNQTEILVECFEVLSSGNPLPAPVVLAYAADLGEAHESVRVCFENPLVCTSEVNSYGEALLEDDSGELMTDDLFYDFEPALGSCWNLCGIGYWSYGVMRCEPTGPEDAVSCDVTAAVEQPEAFELGLAWPNPFNPSTNLSFSVERTAQARLAVYDLLGREVAVLVDGVIEAGAHVAVFDASNLPSGVYFARLASEDRSATQRLLLVR